MLKKTILAIIVFHSAISLSWAVTRHTDYSTGMEIKYCNECHRVNDISPNHSSMWFREHRLLAEKKPNTCDECHQKSFCLDCHKGGGIDRDLHASNSGPDVKPRSHRSDFREIHPIKALDDPETCRRCHDYRKFCNECHEKFNRNDLRLLSHRKGWSELDLKAGGPQHSLFNTSQCQTCHPNSLLPKHQWSSSHASEARKNLISCQTCHPDGDVCMKCHSAVSGLRANPHPGNWSRISGRLRNASDSRSCKKCHITIP